MGRPAAADNENAPAADDDALADDDNAAAANVETAGSGARIKIESTIAAVASA